MIGIDKDTLCLRCAEELESGRALGIATITSKLFEEARRARSSIRRCTWPRREVVAARCARTFGRGGGPIGITILTAVPGPRRTNDGAGHRPWFRPRRWQSESLKRRKRWNVEVVHRRAGKTVKAVMRIIDAALRCDRPTAVWLRCAAAQNGPRRSHGTT